MSDQERDDMEKKNVFEPKTDGTPIEEQLVDAYYELPELPNTWHVWLRRDDYRRLDKQARFRSNFVDVTVEDTAPEGHPRVRKERCIQFHTAVGDIIAHVSR